MENIQDIVDSLNDIKKESLNKKVLEAVAPWKWGTYGYYKYIKTCDNIDEYSITIYGYNLLQIGVMLNFAYINTSIRSYEQGVIGSLA